VFPKGGEKKGCAVQGEKKRLTAAPNEVSTGKSQEEERAHGKSETKQKLKEKKVFETHLDLIEIVHSSRP